MRLALLAPLTLAVSLSAGCGARTGEDELMTGDLATGGLGTGGLDGAGGGSGGGPPDPDKCCSPSAGRGCDDGPIEACVCAQDSFCCDSAWDTACVAAVEDFGCWTCDGGTGGTGGGASGGGSGGGSGGDNSVGTCCTVSTDPGCSDPVVRDCVCAFDDYCCLTAWDSTCVSEVSACNRTCTGTGGQGAGGAGGSSGGQSAGGTGGQNVGGQGTGGQSAGGQSAGGQNTGGQNTGGQNTGGVGGGLNDCCLESGDPGCSDTGVRDCVCQADSYCCMTAWDGLCVDRAEAECGANCGGSGGAPGVGGMPNTGGSAGAGGGGNPYCEGLPVDSCESCMCNNCFNPLLNCINDPGCACIVNTGCTSLFACLSPDACGDVLTGDTAVASLVLALEAANCESDFDCPCQ